MTSSSSFMGRVDQNRPILLQVAAARFRGNRRNAAISEGCTDPNRQQNADALSVLLIIGVNTGTRLHTVVATLHYSIIMKQRFRLPDKQKFIEGNEAPGKGILFGQDALKNSRSADEFLHQKGSAKPALNSTE